MAKITTARRKALPKSEFGLPSKAKKGPEGGAPRGAFPIDTKARAANAKARAMQMFKVGKITMDEFEQIVRRANAKLKASKAEDIQSGSQMLNKVQ